MADNKVSIEISVEGNAQVQFKKLADGAEEFAGKAKKSFLDAGRIFDNFIANLGSNAVNAGINAIKSAFFSFHDVLSDSIKASSEQEDAINNLNSALASSGKFSANASKDLQEFAGSLQSTSKFSDDAVLSATALISSIGKLSAEGLKPATQAAADLAARFNIDLQTAANAVGKAADGNVSVLARYGITVAETGNKTADFAKALEQMQKNFGGSAASQVNTFSGAVAVLNNSYGDVLETLGDTVTQSPAVIEALKFITQQVNVFGAFLNENKNTIMSFVKDGILLALSAFSAMVTAVEVVINLFKKLDFIVKPIKDTLGAFWSIASSVAETVGTTLSDNFATANTTIDKLRESIEKTSVSSSEMSKKVVENSVVVKDAFTETAIYKEALEQNSIIAEEARQQEALTKYADHLFQRNELLRKFDDDKSKQEIERNKKTIEQIQQATKKGSDAEISIKAKAADVEEKRRKTIEETTMDSLTRISTLSQAKTKELAIIGKGAAIAQATIDTIAGATRAYKDLPFPFSFIASGLIAAAGAVNVAKITGVPLKTGITEVPPGFQNDSFPARLQSGERVVSAPQNRDLTEFLAGSSGLTSRLDQLISVLGNGNRTVVNIGGKEIIGAIQDELDSGRSLIV